MNHCINLALLLLLYSMYRFPQTLTAESSPNKTGDADKHLPDLLHQPVIPAGQVVKENNKSSVSGNGKDEVKKQEEGAEETCELAKDSNKCHDDAMNVTACIFHAGDGPVALLVLNDGEGSLKFNFTIPPSESTSDTIDLAAHKVKKINVSASISSATSIVIKADNRTCTIQLGVPLPLPLPLPPPPALPSPSSYSYAAYATPVNGVYVLLGTVFLTGLILGCYKFGKFRRHPEKEVPYQQLEMGNNVQSMSSVDVETAGGGGGGWDQDWDDDWDEEKAVRTPGGNHVVNSGSRFAESNGWDDDWKD